jgi:hypothetical protein
MYISHLHTNDLKSLINEKKIHSFDICLNGEQNDPLFEAPELENMSPGGQ